MFVYFIFFIFLLFAETTETPVASPESAPVSFSSCGQMENEFKRHILSVVDASIDAFRSTANCFGSLSASTSTSLCRETVAKYTSEIRTFRMSQGLIFAEAVKQTVLMSPIPDFTRSCLLNRSGEPEFDNNYRDVKVQGNESEAVGCIGEENRYFGELNTTTEKIISGEIAKNLSRSMLDRVRNFKQTPLHFAMSDRLKFQMNLTNNEIREELSPVFDRFLADSQRVKERITALSPTRNYMLYEFQNQFSTWKQTLDTGNQSFAQTCYDQSGFVRNCTNRTQLSRCGAQLWDVTEQVLPVFSLIDGLTTLRETRENFNSELMTTNEFTAAKTEAMLQTMLGLTEVIPSSSLVSAALRSTRPLLTRGAEALGSGLRAVERRALDLTRPIPVRSCVPRDCLVSQINMTDDALSHVVRRHSRPDISTTDVESIIARNQDDYKALVDRYNSLVSRGARQSTLDTAIKNIKDRIAADFADLRLERVSATTHFPPGITVEELLLDLPQTQLQRIDRNTSASVYRFERDNTQYAMVICRRPPCPVDGRIVTRQDEVLTMYPLCGPTVSRFPSVANLARALVASGNLTLSNFFQVQHCP